jgi:hypothetical protein
MEHAEVQQRSPVRTIVGLNLNLQAAKRRLRELDDAAVRHGGTHESESDLLERGKLQGQIDYFISAINELKGQR